MNDSLLQTFESYGGFWLPDNEKRIVPGQLKLDPGGSLELILSDELHSDENAFVMFQKRDRIPIILGQLVNGRLVTLVDGLPVHQQMGFGPGGPSTLQIHFAFLGAHIASIDNLRVISFETSFTLLEQWAAHTDISSEYVMAPDGITKTEWQIHCRFPPDQTFDISRTATSITLSQQLDSDCGRTAFSVTPVSFFKIQPNAPMTFESARQVQWNLQNLMTLLTGYAVAPRFFHLELDEPDDKLKMPTTSLEVLCVLTLKNPQRQKFTEQLLIPLSLIRPRFGQILNQWFDVVERSKVALDVCFGSLYQPASVLNLRFLAVMQAVEAFHRSAGAGLYMDDDAYKTLIEKLKEQIPSEIQGSHRESLKKRLQYGNDFSQRKRFKMLIEALPDDVRREITLNPKEFIEWVVTTRNQFTHYNSKPEGRVLEGAQIFWASERLRWLLNATILLEIGIEKDKLSGILRNNNSYREATYSDMPFARNSAGSAS